jgi:hypothetical protein
MSPSFAPLPEEVSQDTGAPPIVLKVGLTGVVLDLDDYSHLALEEIEDFL